MLRFISSIFGSELLGLNFNDFIQSKADSLPQAAPNRPVDVADWGDNSESGSSVEDDCTEDAVLRAIHESEINLWKMKKEHPEDFRFDEDGSTVIRRESADVKGSGGRSNIRQKVMTSKLRKPTSFSKILREPVSVASESPTDSPETPSRKSLTESPKDPLTWEIDTSGFDKTKNSKTDENSITNSRLPRKKSTKSADVSRSWTRKSDVLANVNRELIPANTAEPFMIGAERKVLDLQRWYCISRPQYKASCGISSVVSCWNYLYSTLGRGSLKPITQEEALTILGFKPDFSEIRFGPFTGNATLMRWFHNLNEYYGVVGRTYFLYKPKGRNTTLGVTSDKALSRLKEGLHRADKTFIYHCSNHYFCPIGYDETSIAPTQAYRAENLRGDGKESWILIGDTSRKHPSMHCIKWEDIVKDLNTGNPDYYDIRRLWKGQQQRKKSGGGNLHCIMAFEKSHVGMRGTSSVPLSDTEDLQSAEEDLDD